MVFLTGAKGSTRLILPPTWLKRRQSPRVSFSARGQAFEAREAEIPVPIARKLGINPACFRPGLKIFYLNKADHARFARAFGFAGSIAGFYPLSVDRAVEQVYSGERERLPDGYRIIVLPEGPQKKSLIAHEVLHDVLIGGGISTEHRETFVRYIPAWVKNADQQRASRKKEFDFFLGVARKCARELDLGITEADLIAVIEGEQPSFDFFVFAGECFAYGGELFLGYAQDKDLGELPREIAHFFREEIHLAA